MSSSPSSSSKQKDSENAPNPNDVGKVQKPRSGVSYGDRHEGWYCCNSCLRHMKDGLSALSLDEPESAQETVRFMNDGLARCVLALFPGVPIREDIQSVVFVRKTFAKADGRPRERDYHFAKDTHSHYYEIKPDMYNSLTGMEMVESWKGKRVLEGMCKITHEFEVYRKATPIESESTRVRTPKGRRPKGKRDVNSAEHDEALKQGDAERGRKR